MQFAGQRTDMNFRPIGEAYNLLVALNDDTLPSPEAITVTGISPQKTIDEGYTEAQFAQILKEEVFVNDTIVVGFNNIRFDDEFLRYLFWRNFHDPYDWAWSEGRSRWDMLDVVRMTRALRPGGITWPFDDQGNPTNRLELLTKQNGISHDNAHDALADVQALIGVTNLIKSKQPQLFEFLLNLRNKKQVQKLINLDDKKSFVYVSGRYDSAWQKATVAFPLAPAPNSNVLVYDLRHDPSQFFSMSEQELSANLFASYAERQEAGYQPIPVKVLQYNRCPAVAPIGVLEVDEGWKNIGLTIDVVQANTKKLISRPDFAEKLRTVYEKREGFGEGAIDPEARLYEGFLDNRDRLRVETIPNLGQDELADFHPDFKDERLDGLFLHYKARNYKKSLSQSEQESWEDWRAHRLSSQLPQYLESLGKMMSSTDSKVLYLAEELKLWAESIMPSDD